MTELLESELKIECQVWKAKAEVWEQAYNKLLVNKYTNNISLPKTTEDNLNEFQEQQVIDFIDKEIAPN